MEELCKYLKIMKHMHNISIVEQVKIFISIFAKFLKEILCVDKKFEVKLKK